jgi:hypothetical protein
MLETKMGDELIVVVLVTREIRQERKQEMRQQYVYTGDAAQTLQCKILVDDSISCNSPRESLAKAAVRVASFR